MSKTYLEFSDDKAHKFYEVEVDGCEVLTRYGRVGTKGQSRAKTYDSADEARREADKKLAAKRKKGYAEQSGEEAEAEVTAAPAQAVMATFRQANTKQEWVAPSLWQFSTGADAFGICADDEGCWVGNESGFVSRLSHDGDIQLQFALRDGVKCIVADESWLYAGCNDGKVYDLSGKVPFMAYAIPDAVDLHWLDINDGRLAVSDAFGQVSVIDHEGEFVWRRTGERTSGWMVRCDPLGVFHGHSKGVSLYSWDDGSVIWEQPLPRSVLFGWSEPSAIYAATSGRKIHQFSKQGEAWEQFYCDASVYSCTAAFDGELVFAGDNAASIYCFSGDGTRLWKAKTGCGSALSMHFAHDSLYIVTNQGTLARIDVRQEALAAAAGGQDVSAARKVEATSTPVSVSPEADLAALETVSLAEGDADDGVILECYKQGGKLRVRVASDGYERDWNVQFPKALREEGARYLVEGVKVSASGGFYRAYGDIKRL